MQIAISEQVPISPPLSVAKSKATTRRDYRPSIYCVVLRQVRPAGMQTFQRGTAKWHNGFPLRTFSARKVTLIHGDRLNLNIPEFGYLTQSAVEFAYKQSRRRYKNTSWWGFSIKILTLIIGNYYHCCVTKQSVSW